MMEQKPLYKSINFMYNIFCPGNTTVMGTSLAISPLSQRPGH